MSFKPGQVYSLPHNSLAFNEPHSLARSQMTQQILTGSSIYSKAVAWWELDETNGNLYKDGVVLHGSSQYNMQYDANPGLANTQPTLRLGGANSILCTSAFSPGLHIVNGHIVEIVGAMDHSVIAWYKPNSPNTAVRNILCEFNNTLDDTGNGQFGLLVSAAGNPGSRWSFSAAQTQEVNLSSSVLVAGTTYFLGYNKITAGKLVEHYTNGALQKSSAYVNEPTGGGAQINMLGSIVGSAVNGADGFIQGVAVFTPALTAVEHAFLYNSGNGYSCDQIKALAGRH